MAEKVRDGVDGFLVDPFQPDAIRALSQSSRPNRARSETLRDKVATPRSMDEVGSEMITIYESVCA